MNYSPYFDQEEPQVPVKGLIADLDRSPSWELEACAVFKTEERGYLVVEVSGCSCWPDRGSTSQTVCQNKTQVETALRNYGYSEMLDTIQAASWNPIR